MSLSDGGAPMLTMPVQPTNSGGFGFGGDGAWWLIVLFLFAFCGWGGDGWGNNAGSSNDKIYATARLGAIEDNCARIDLC